MPNSQRDPKQEFAKKRLPGAQYLDLDEVAAPSDMGLKHMMPSPQQFKEACGKYSACHLSCHMPSLASPLCFRVLTLT